MTSIDTHQSPQTMHSFDFSILTGKPHANIKRTMTAMRKANAIRFTKEMHYYEGHNNTTQRREVYVVDEENAYKVMQRIDPAFREQLVKFFKYAKNASVTGANAQSLPAEPPTISHKWDDPEFMDSFADTGGFFAPTHVGDSWRADADEFMDFLVKINLIKRLPPAQPHLKGKPWPTKWAIREGLALPVPFVKGKFSGLHAKLSAAGCEYAKPRWDLYVQSKEREIGHQHHLQLPNQKKGKLH